ncbi:Enoyl-CoA hydratase [Nitrincola lacisaponensis]|uniref:Enoyl-CoA hydratase domain-containing protein 3, mitochondrial n=1 Tax=Nitrincola lacisaponensis TaxID=267850 RepID=A0A063Y7L9_9GAMM|nr:enoyl-CoA hydratase [Nitrincola lacisaponensis]KDE40751.1 Enoyl-CoA hydratase [Nitrincola lacisaponensis]
MNSDSLILSQLSETGVLRLTLNDESRRNALSEAMLNQLQKVISDVSEDPQVRVVILAASGPAFCAGHNLKEMTAGRAAEDQGRAYFARIMQLCSSVMQSIVNCPKPIIAEVKGIATAAGCQLVASCDLAVASTEAKFSTPGVHIGLFCSTPMVALSRNLSNKHAMEMLLLGDMVSAERAAEMGLVNRVVPEGVLQQVTQDMADRIASKSSKTLAIGKRAFYVQREMSLSDAYEYASAVMVDNMLESDAQEGIRAFMEKREPKWQD